MLSMFLSIMSENDSNSSILQPEIQAISIPFSRPQKHSFKHAA
jgi:hypothetical protein